MNILYNALATEERDEERGKQEATIGQIAAALSDTNRLRILAAITQDPEVYGHKLARMCGISQPAISRHMGILKRAGLVEKCRATGGCSTASAALSWKTSSPRCCATSKVKHAFNWRRAARPWRTHPLL